MDEEVLKTAILAVIEPVLKDNFTELVDMEVLANGSIIRLYIDKINSRITLDECADISRLVSAALDTAQGINPDYSLEVSSPGINRPLIKQADFTRFEGKKAKIVTKERIGSEKVFTGVLEGFEGGNVVLKTALAQVQVPFDNIRKANIEEDLF